MKIKSFNVLHAKRWLLNKQYKYAAHLRGLVVRVSGYRSRGPGSIPGATRFSEK
jgi:hypothetical protein